ncbi:unnamed protein product, partial [Staurois parvus]
MICQSAPASKCLLPLAEITILLLALPLSASSSRWMEPSLFRDHPGSYLFFIGFFEFGQGHRGPMIPYYPGGP